MAFITVSWKLVYRRLCPPWETSSVSTTVGHIYIADSNIMAFLHRCSPAQPPPPPPPPSKLSNTGEVLSEPICFNQRISVGNTFLMHKHWVDKGVYCVAHFLNEEGKILSHIDFQRKFDITTDCVTYSGNKEISA